MVIQNIHGFVLLLLYLPSMLILKEPEKKASVSGNK